MLDRGGTGGDDVAVLESSSRALQAVEAANTGLAEREKHGESQTPGDVEQVEEQQGGCGVSVGTGTRDNYQELLTLMLAE